MGIFQNNLMGAAAAAASSGGAAFYDHQIDQSFRWDSGYLKRTPGSAGNRQIWTFSCWMKQSGTITNSQGDMAILNAGSSGNQDTRFRMYFNEQKLRSSSNEANYNVSPGLYRDPSAWMHIVWKLTGGVSYQYVNGVLITNESVSGNVAINNNVEHTMGVYAGYETASRFKGYLAEVVFTDGTAYNPSDFGETKNGVWIPKDPSGLTFGSQGYHLDFASASDPGNDVSGNNNDWTNVSLATHDKSLDSPTFNSDSNGGNFATLGPLGKFGGADNGNPTLTEGNLKADAFGGSSGNIKTVPATFGITSGKWYWEVYVNTQQGGLNIGLCNDFFNLDAELGYTSPSSPTGADVTGYYASNGQTNNAFGSNGFTSYGDAFDTDGTIIGVAFDADNGKSFFSKNGTWQNSGNPATGSNPARGSGGAVTTAFSFSKPWFPVVSSHSAATPIVTMNFGQDGTFAGTKTAGGNSDDTGYGNFFYDVPAGFLAMCSGNLPVAEEIDPAQTDDDFPQKLFSPIIYTGNGSNRSITGLGFKPDWLWFKARSNTERWTVYDSTRGTGKYLTLNTDGDQGTDSSTLSAFGSDGFSLGTNAFINGNSTTFANFSWRANGGTTATNTAGDMDTTVQVDPSGHFSIVKYVGNGSVGQTWGHGLSVKPDFIVLKKTSGNEDWVVYHSALGATKYLSLNTSSAVTTGNEIWYGTEPTSTVVYVDNNGRANYPSGQTYIAYCFANSEGFIKAGSYVGNGNADGSFVYTGFKPAMVLVKFNGSGENWVIADNKRNPVNVADNILKPSNSNAEADGSTYAIDILSNGFKPRTTWEGWNGTGSEGYVYLAFAENPFKYATAR